MTAQSKLLIAWVGLCTYLVLSLCSLAGAVLCIEPNGQVALEPAVNGACNDMLRAEASLPASALVKALPCKQCVDVSLGLHGVAHSLDRLQAFSLQLQTVQLAATESFRVGYLSRVSRVRLAQPPPYRKSPIHAHLSVVVLLI